MVSRRNFQSSRAGHLPYVRRMITAIIETENEEVALAHALAALVPAATEGIVRDVIVIDRGSQDGTREVADAAGCTIIDGAQEPDATRLAVEQARGDWLLFTPASQVLQPEWQADAMAFIDRALTDGQAAEALGDLPRWAAGVGSVDLAARHDGGRRHRPPGGQIRLAGGDGAVYCAGFRSFDRFRCSSRRGMISTKLHGAWR